MNNTQSDDSCNLSANGTPLDVYNAQGQSALRYRIGTHGHFKDMMLRKLSDFQQLRGLTTHADEDATPALIDGWAAALDVLTFYQERIINEGYLPTATERRSIRELANSIGYKLSPGVAASTYLSFTLERTITGDDTVVLHNGLQVQSIPEQDEKPQMFETIEKVTGRVAWNILTPQKSACQVFDRTTDTLYVQGTSVMLSPGDLILLVGSHREADPASERWDVRQVREIVPLYDIGITRISWDTDLGHKNPVVEPAESPRVFTLRKKASLFGYNAADWRVLPQEIKNAYAPAGTVSTEWPQYHIGTVADKRIDLDREYDGILPGDWVVLDRPVYRELYGIKKSYTAARNDYGLTGRITALVLDGNENLSSYPLRQTTVYISDAELKIAEKPVTSPVFGDAVLLSEPVPHMETGRTVVVRGRTVEKLRVVYPMESDATRDPDSSVKTLPLLLLADDGVTKVKLAYGDIVTLLEPPQQVSGNKLLWHVETESGVQGTVETMYDELEPIEPHIPKESAIPSVYDHSDTVETAIVKSMFIGDTYSTIVFQAPLQNIYMRSSLKIYGNTVAATHGESRKEPLGSGDSSLSHQEFRLRQFPLTYVPAITDTGTQSSLEIRVDGIAWKEIPSLYTAGPHDRVFSVKNNDDGTAMVCFGDGIRGERLPTGRDNVNALYRIGIGIDGQVHRGQISLAMSRPLGFKEVVNHVISSDAQNAESLDESRINAPHMIITMGRIVSLADYENFARTFAGIGKALAAILWSGERSIIHLTVGSSDGKPISAQSELIERLTKAINKARHADHQLMIDTYIEETFGCSCKVKIVDNYDTETVLSQVKNQLIQTYNFFTRDFARGIAASELLALVQSVEGVEAAILSSLNGTPPSALPYITAAGAHWDANEALVIPASLLTIDPDQIILEELTL
jgi:hypothetical protein